MDKKVMVEKIMELISGPYTPDSGMYRKVSAGLSRLTLDHVDGVLTLVRMAVAPKEEDLKQLGKRLGLPEGSTLLNRKNNIILVTWDRKYRREYITWQIREFLPGKWSHFLGHYFGTLDSAFEDFQKRTGDGL